MYVALINMRITITETVTIYEKNGLQFKFDTLVY